MEAPRPYLHAARGPVRLARRFRKRVDAKLKCPAQRNVLRRQGLLQGFELCCGSTTTDACRHARRPSRAKPSQGRGQPKILTPKGRKDFCFHRGLTSLNQYTSPHDASLSTVAAFDSSFLKFDAQRTLRLTRLEQASDVMEITTLLLAWLPGAMYNSNARRQAAVGYSSSTIDDLDFLKYLANLEHVLRCIQHLALVCLVQRSLEVLGGGRKPRKDFEAQRKDDGDWFEEWSGGRPPLSSTMPWNIKPSLVVLWGVCWMFYAPSNHPQGPGHEGAGAWTSGQPVAPSNMTGYTIPSPASHQGAMQRRPSVAHGSPDTRSHPNPLPRSNMIGQISEANHPRIFNTAGMTHFGGHMTTGYSPIGSGELYADASFPGSSDSIVANPQPDNNPPSITSQASPATFATSPTTWRERSGYPPRITHRGSALPSQPRSEQAISVSAPQSTPPYYDPFAQANPYAPQYDITSTSPSPFQPFPPPGFNHPSNPGSSAKQGHRFSTMHSSQISYPSPQHSEASEAPSSLVRVSMAEKTASPQAQAGPSPSLGRSSASRRPSAGQADPPRNAQGQIYCDHPECASNQPTFARKCEWTKHNDKHTRPYVCREPGCEKIRGFTYSGGLLRHQREVHRRHGGPRAPRFCPHRDCKRSTGPGFSRKENLNEHLRRVHRGVGLDSVDSPSGSGPTSGAPSVASPSMIGLQTPATQPPSRKRRRGDPDPEGEGLGIAGSESAEGDLGDVGVPPMPTPTASLREHKREIQRLRAELAERDNTIRQRDDRIRQLQHDLAQRSQQLQTMMLQAQAGLGH